MPKSKRNREVHTSKIRKNRKELVRRLHANIQEAAQQYAYIWVFDVENMRNNFIKQVRADLHDSRIFMGKTKVMAVALGHNAETETVPGCHALGPFLKGDVGLLFTQQSPEEIRDFFADLVETDFARSGATAIREFRIPPGQLFTESGTRDPGDPIPLAIEPQLRKLGVPTRIVKGKVTLEEAGADNMADEDGYLVCREGEALEPRQTNILKIFGVKMAEFRVALRAVYEKESGTVKDVVSMELD